VIRLKQNAQRSGVDKWIKQLQVNDVTAKHMDDAGALGEIIEQVTGISKNMQGQYHTGRRSAREASNVQANGSNRLITIASINWTCGLGPLGRMMLSNLRDGLDEQTYVRVLGDGADPSGFAGFVPATKEKLAGNYDFEMFDGTLPSEKAANAQTLQELLMGMMSNPEVIQLLGYDPKALLREILLLKGIRNPERFILVPPGTPPPGTVQPDPNQMQNGNSSVRQMNGAPTITKPNKSGNQNEPFDLISDAGSPSASSVVNGVVSW
jgi:hypothetical protein